MGAADGIRKPRYQRYAAEPSVRSVWLNDSAEGNLRSAVAVSRAANAFTRDDQPVSLLVTVAMADEQPTAVLNRLSKLLLDKKADRLLKADAATVLALLTSDDAIAGRRAERRNSWCAMSTACMPDRAPCWSIRLNNSPADITVTNLDGSGKPANGRSLMKVVGAGCEKGSPSAFHRAG